jgi:hypothetical protein
MTNKTPEEIRQRYQQILFELQTRLLQTTPKSAAEISQSLNYAIVTEEDLRSLSKAYKVMLDGCPEGQIKCWDGSCVDPGDPCPPEESGGFGVRR